MTIAGTPQRATELNLASLGLNGELSGLLGELEALTELRLNGNALTGGSLSKLTTLTNLTHPYLAGRAFEGCPPPELRSLANNDLAAPAQIDCRAPSYISYGEHTLTAVMFDVPTGLNLEIVGIVCTESDDGDPTIGLTLRNTSEESWNCVDLEAAEACDRKIVSNAQRQHLASPPSSTASPSRSGWPRGDAGDHGEQALHCRAIGRAPDDDRRRSSRPCLSSDWGRGATQPLSERGHDRSQLGLVNAVVQETPPPPVTGVFTWCAIRTARPSCTTTTTLSGFQLCHSRLTD